MKIADLFFSGRLDDGPLQIDAKKSGDKAGETLGKSLSASIKKSWNGQELGKGLIQGLGLAGGLGAARLLEGGLHAVTDVIGESITAASDLNESMSKSQVIFGDAAGEIADFASTADKSLGLSKQAALEAAASFGNLFLGTGQSQEEAAKLSKKLVTLAGDLASFNNLDPTETLEKLRSGLTGEAEPLRSVGVFLTEAKVKAKGLELGLADAHGEMTEGAKVMARYAIILDETKTAQGDYARTADGVANTQRTLNAEIENAKAELGQELLPLEKQWLQTQRDAIPVLGTLLGAIHDSADGFGEIIGQIQVLNPILDLMGARQTYVAGHLDHAAGSADDFGTSLKDVADKGDRAASDLVTDAGRIERAFRTLKVNLLADATKIVDDYFDVLIAQDDLAATNAEINALRQIAAGRKLTREEQANLHRLEQTQAQLVSDLATHGATQSKTFKTTMTGLLNRLKSAHGAEKRMIEAEILKLQLLAISAKIAKGQVLSLNESNGATLAKGGYVSAAGAKGKGKAAGGPVQAGVAYPVNERTAKTEWFVPEVDGRIMTHAQMMGTAPSAPSITNYYNTATVLGMPKAHDPLGVARELGRAARNGTFRPAKVAS